MKALIFEGNLATTSQQMVAHGGIPYHQLFCNVMHAIDPNITTEVAYPTEANYTIIPASELQQYDAVLWTGSALDPDPSIPQVHRQIAQSQQVFKSQIPYYGSCWGLQIAVLASGGKTALCKNGVEIGIAKNIHLTEAGRTHPLLKNRTAKFNAFCIHFSEISKIPNRAKILAYNAHSQVQALEITHDGGVFFGVQYHPEYTIATMQNAYRRNHQKLLQMGIYQQTTNPDVYVENMVQQSNIGDFDASVHTQEIRNFLEYARAERKTKGV